MFTLIVGLVIVAISFSESDKEIDLSVFAVTIVVDAIVICYVTNQIYGGG